MHKKRRYIDNYHRKVVSCFIRRQLTILCEHIVNEIDQSFTNVDKIISEIKNYKDQDANQHLSSMNKKLKELNSEQS